MTKILIKTNDKNYLTEPDFDKECFVNYPYKGKTYKLWYGIIGTGNKPPVLILHGGPGGNHYNLVSFQALAIDRPVIFYDQLGCGKSDRPDDSSLWIAERYFNEVMAIRDGLELKKYHLIGHSWGTTLAVGFAAKHADGIMSVSLHSPILSFPRYIEKIAPKLKRDLKGLNGKAGQIIDDYELKSLGTKEKYDKACLEFTEKYVTNSCPLPEAINRLINSRNLQIHNVMVASESELNVSGNLKTVDVTLLLSKIKLPVLITCGSDDLCTPDYTKWQAGFAKDVESHIIPGSAHMTLVDKPIEMIRIQSSFLDKVEDIKCLSTHRNNNISP